ncbi:hypothetical protein VQ056_30005, partial [Paenibacillus sp. JTLBN-2024]
VTELVLEEKAKGTTFLMSFAQLFPEIERTCDRAAIIKDGKLIAVKNNIHETPGRAAEAARGLLRGCRGPGCIPCLLGLKIESCKDNRVRDSRYRGIITGSSRKTSKYRIRSIDVASQNLEDIFMDYHDRKGATDMNAALYGQMLKNHLRDDDELRVWFGFLYFCLLVLVYPSMATQNGKPQ